MDNRNISNKSRAADLNQMKKIIVKRFKTLGDSEDITVEEKVTLLNKLASFPLGEHILLTGGADGFWTDYMISFPWETSREAAQRLLLSRIEHYILYECFSVLSQRELFVIAQKVMQSFVKNNGKLASIPCGLARDLLSLDYSKVKNIQLVGIDLDKKVLVAAKERSKKLKHIECLFFEKDAWKLEIESEFDLVSSIGLNVYEKKRSKVIELYKEFYTSLKKGGALFTGVLTYPPWENEKTDWEIENIEKVNIEMEKIIIRDILDLTFQNYRSKKEIKEDFYEAGFSKVEIFKDTHFMFPGVLAVK